MKQQCLATLQTLLADSGSVAIEAPLLERFYKHCARQPGALHRRLTSCPLKTLLYHYRFLRPAMQAGLLEFVTDRWRIFTADIALPDRTEAAPKVGCEPASPVHESSSNAIRFASPGMRADWFERFLDGVRILLFR